MRRTLHNIFDDAHRRVCIHASGSLNKTRAEMWIGLGTPSEMRPAVEKGYIKPFSHETPRILGWYLFTPEGWAEYDRRYKNAPDWFLPAFQNYIVPPAPKADTVVRKDGNPDSGAPVS